jgi:hypothetical protein
MKTRCWWRGSREPVPNVVERASQVAEIAAALLLRWRADAEQGHIGPVEGNGRIRGCSEVSTHDGSRYELVDARLNDRTAARSDLVYLHRVNINATYLVTS